MAGRTGVAPWQDPRLVTNRLLFDEMYPETLATVLRDKGHDVLAVATSTGLVGKDDAFILEAATIAGRCVVTEDVRDYTTLARSTRHAGILLVAASRWPRTRSRIPRLTNALHDALSEGRIPGPNEILWLG